MGGEGRILKDEEGAAYEVIRLSKARRAGGVRWRVRSALWMTAINHSVQ